MYPTFAVIARGKRRFSASFLRQRVKFWRHVISNEVRNLLFAWSGSKRIRYPGYGVRERISRTITVWCVLPRLWIARVDGWAGFGVTSLAEVRRE
ncbi:MAG: hypothetical protein A2Z18_06155 [Armatimonadetes bacterium RBG_16_58_9]|nr:MAG: hypothetical protein A2Z18_06155 [Armatimonadetes bacterium RBG_16_58_9]